MLQERYSILFEKLPHAFAYHKMLLDSNGKAIDYIFEDVNRAFQEMTGLTKDVVIGHKVTEVLPTIDKASFDWIQTYGKVASTGKSINFQQYSEPLEKWYEVTAFSYEEGYFGTIFLEITDSIQEKDALKELIDLSEQYFNFSPNEIDYQKITETMLKISNAKFVAFNLYNQAQTAYTTVAIASTIKQIKSAESMLGFKIVGKKWPHDPVRAAKIQGKSVVRFKGLANLTNSTIPKPAVALLEKVFDVGEVGVASILHGDRMLGDFTILMANGKHLYKEEYIKILSELVGQYIERKAAEKSLRKKTEKLSAEHSQMLSIFDSLDAMIYVIDMTTYEILFVNKFGMNLYGNINGKTCWSAISQNQQGPCAFCAKEKLLANGLKPHESVEAEYYNDAVKKWYRCTDSAITWTDDRIVKLHVAYDITERKKVEEKDQFISTVMMNIFDSVIISDTKQKITYINKGAQELFGYTSEELIGQSTAILSQDPNIQQMQKELYQAISAGNNFMGEVLNVRKDGSTFLCEFKVAPILDTNGKPYAYVGTQRDITEKKEKHKEIEYLSFHDFLTGLYNRRYLEDSIQRLDIERNLPFAVIVVDVNGLKRVNDTYGHEMGDQVIKAVSDILKTACRADDIVARTGGDEFVIVLPKTYAVKAESIKTKINELAALVRLESGTVSLAVGYAIKIKGSSDMKDVIKEADNNMYLDKAARKSEELKKA